MDSEKGLESLLKASSILFASLDFNELLKKIMQIVSEIMESEKGAIYLVDNETGNFALTVAQENESTGNSGLRIKREPGAASIAGLGIPILIEDATKDSRWQVNVNGTKSVLCVPLQYGEKVLGLIEVINKKDGTTYTTSDLRFFQGLSNICASAILNSSKFTALIIENNHLKQNTSPNFPLLGNSTAMTKVFTLIKKADSTDALVLITGESGTGKEVVAKALHLLSSRKEKPFLPINCGALPETLLESELFGHEKGAFTGADKLRIGIFEEAEGGTVFLDEIGELSLSTQVKLLRVLQEGKVKRLGSNKEITFNARIVAATNRSIEEMVKTKQIREDLYYRINVLRISIPPLRNRIEDIPLLAEYFLKKASSKIGKKVVSFSPAVLRSFTSYNWRGNVRELENTIESSVAMAESDSIELTDLPELFHEYKPSGFDATSIVNMTYEEASATFEKGYFSSLLTITNNDITEAALKAGVSEKSVHRRKKEFGL